LLHRGIAGSLDQIKIVYGIAGERRLAEWEVPWLDGSQGASPPAKLVMSCGWD